MVTAEGLLHELSLFLFKFCADTTIILLSDVFLYTPTGFERGGGYLQGHILKHLDRSSLEMI